MSNEDPFPFPFILSAGVTTFPDELHAGTVLLAKHLRGVLDQDAIYEMISVNTMGIVALAFLAAKAAWVGAVTMTSTLRRTSSAARAGSRSSFPSAYR